MIRTALVGGTGYGGMELLRLSLLHPELEIATVTSRTSKGAVVDVHPGLRGLTELSFVDASADDLAETHDLLVFATPHGVAASEIGPLLERHPDVRVIDLSGDHRLRDADEYARHYGKAHAHPEALEKAVYGLPECGARGAVRGARLVANPGCHASATLLALWPLVREGLVTGRPAVASVTGSSGSGSAPGKGTHHPERFASFKAYKPLDHQHVPEIEQHLRGVAPAFDGVDFVPHSAPFSRGIAVTAFVPVKRGREREAVQVLRSTYEDEVFVRLVPGTPEVRAVAGSNFADVAAVAGTGTVCVFVTIDNLVKGMAGTAVQNANLMFGLDETTGLRHAALGP
ncbi:MAG: N-acetyl-gamma-glutamyl-phosphate reductase [Planctomycetes bacterium]|nr:N-acetyl-gamma-glutamyl-phosphate reductase [Planctomycetota bacterium]